MICNISHFQLDNIQNHIKLTKEHIDALNATFASYQKPPQIFISEYEEWTEKLHKFTLVRRYSVCLGQLIY